MKLSKNFTLKEMTRSITAKRRDIDNTPDEQQIENLAELCEKVLQPLRDLMGPIVITSGYRRPALNTAIGGSTTSQHCAIKGAAADIDICTGDCDYKNAEVFHNIKDNFVFDQLIWAKRYSNPSAHVISFNSSCVPPGASLNELKIPLKKFTSGCL